MNTVGSVKKIGPVRGFTLLELLVALAIFGLLSVMAYGGLRSVLAQNELTGRSAQQLSQLQKTYLVLQRDIEQVVPRAIRDEFGDENAPLTGGRALQLTRGGWANPASYARSTLQRVGYALEDQQLVRYAWPVLDRAQDSQARVQRLVNDVAQMQIRYLDEGEEWQEQWPVEGSATAEGQAQDLPIAVELTIELENLGPVSWLFRMPR